MSLGFALMDFVIMEFAKRVGALNIIGIALMPVSISK